MTDANACSPPTIRTMQVPVNPSVVSSDYDQFLIHMIRTIEVIYGNDAARALTQNLENRYQMIIQSGAGRVFNHNQYRFTAITNIVNRIKTTEEQNQLKGLCLAISTIDVDSDAWTVIDINSLWYSKFNSAKFFSKIGVSAEEQKTALTKVITMLHELNPDATIFDRYDNAEILISSDPNNVRGIDMSNIHAFLYDQFRSRI